MKDKIEEAAKQYAEGKSSSPVFQAAHIEDFMAGAKFSDASKEEPKVLEELKKEFDKIIFDFLYNDQDEDDIWNFFAPYLRGVSNPNEDKDVRKIALETFHKFLPEHKDNAMSWHIYKRAFDIANYSLNPIQNIEEAVEFAEFVGENGYEYSPSNKDWNKFDTIGWSYRTTSELYTEFLKSKGITPVEK